MGDWNWHNYSTSDRWNKTGSDKCLRKCLKHIGNHTNTLQSVNGSWKNVFNAPRKVFQCETPKGMKVGLLGLLPQSDVATVADLLQIHSAAAAKCVTSRWLNPRPITSGSRSYGSCTKWKKIVHMHYTFRYQKFLKKKDASNASDTTVIYCV